MSCRYFGADPEFWEDHLTGERIRAQMEELQTNPPVDWVVAMVFLKHNPDAQGSAVISPPPAPGVVAVRSDNTAAITMLMNLFPKGAIH